MEMVLTDAPCHGKRISIRQGRKELAHAYVYLMTNGTGRKTRRFAFVEDVFVRADARGKGLARQLYERIATFAKHHDCYKIVACSRMERDGVHAMMAKLGYKKHGFEFRLDVEK